MTDTCYGFFPGSHPQLKGLCQLEVLKMKGTMDEPVYVFEEDFQRANAAMPREVKLKFGLQKP